MGNVFSIQCGLDALFNRCWDCIALQPQYICELEDNLKALETAVDELAQVRNDVKRKVDNQQTDVTVQLDQVRWWREKVEVALTEVTGLIDRGKQETQKLCLCGLCSKNCKSSYILGKSLVESLKQIIELKDQGANFEVVVIQEPSKQLHADLIELNTTREQLSASKEDVERRIYLEEGPEQRPLKKVVLWLSAVEKTILEAGELVKEGPQKVSRFSRGDSSSYAFVGKVANSLGAMTALISQGGFDQVVGKALPERVVKRDQEPMVGTGAMLATVWNCLVKDEVGILGIYGIGGVGKSSLLTAINNKFANTPNDFDVVIWVVVSKDLKLEKLQEDIWKHIGFCDEKWLKKSSKEKADDISYKMQRKKYVLLLDDVWQQFNLSDVGVPSPDVFHNGSKVVFTSRAPKICIAMKAKKLIEVKPLTSEDAWKLFQEKVGHVDSDIIPIAQQVASECCGLPILLITIACTMASTMSFSRNTEEWRHTLQVLKNSTSNLRGTDDEVYQNMEMHVFKSLKLSYDWLPNRRVQSCFLYCSLFPEDFKIAKNDLVHYWACEDFCSIERGYFIISTLVRQGLLEESGEYVKMHDVIRDLALWIAGGEEEEIFFVRAGSQLTEVPHSGEWYKVKRVSLMANSFKYFEGIRSRCCNMVTLFLSRNPNLGSVHGGVFRDMTKLTVLDLSDTVIEKLPGKVFSLVSLQYLNLSHTRLLELPKQLTQLVRLKYLNLDHTGLLQMIPAELLCKLSKLQVLKMFLCGSMTYHNVKDNVLANGKLLIEELLQLENLVELSLTIRSDLQLQKLFEEPRLLNCTRALVLQEIKDFDSLNISSMAMAEHLGLVLMFGNISLKKIVVAATGLRNNQPIFSSLREVVVSNDNGMQELTWVGLAPNLTVLRVTFNKYIESIVSPEALGEFQDGDGSSKLFPKLQLLELYGLPELKSVYSRPLAFPCLRQIDVYDCPMLKKLPLSATGCKVVIKGEESWWNNLDWEDDATRAAFSSSFQKI